MSIVAVLGVGQGEFPVLLDFELSKAGNLVEDEVSEGVGLCEELLALEIGKGGESFL